MTRATLVGAIAASAILAGCVSYESREYIQDGPKACDATNFQDLVGAPSPSLDRSDLPQTVRIVCHDCMVTKDYRPERLNIRLGPDGRVASVDCG